MGIVKINRSGKTVNVYNTTSLDSIIGKIYPNEMFTWVEEDRAGAAVGYGKQRIMFRNSQGEATHGWLNVSQSDACLATNLCELPKFTETINGKTYYGFELRRLEHIYDGNANYLGFVEPGATILCDSSACGATHHDWLNIDFVEEEKGTGRHVAANPNGQCFIDLGYNFGSTFTTNCSLIGSL